MPAKERPKSEAPRAEVGFPINAKTSLNLCRITTPRFSPIAIRNIAGLLGHEHFHQVLLLANFFHEYMVKLWEDSSSTTRQQCQKITLELTREFGDCLSQSSTIRFNLRVQLDSWAKNKNIPCDPSRRNHDGEARTSIVNNYIDELLADLAGFLLSGPAYIFPLITLSQDNPQLEVDLLHKRDSPRKDLSTHPPSIVRVKFQIKMLKEELGFENYERTMAEMF